MNILMTCVRGACVKALLGCSSRRFLLQGLERSLHSMSLYDELGEILLMPSIEALGSRSCRGPCEKILWRSL